MGFFFFTAPPGRGIKRGDWEDWEGREEGDWEGREEEGGIGVGGRLGCFCNEVGRENGAEPPFSSLFLSSISTSTITSSPSSDGELVRARFLSEKEEERDKMGREEGE